MSDAGDGSDSPDDTSNAGPDGDESGHGRPEGNGTDHDGADSGGSDDDWPKAGRSGGRGRNDSSLPQLNRYFDALSNKRRRYALYYLQQRGTTDEDDLARHVVARETGRLATDVPADEYGNVQSELHHKHLPRLADYGLVEFDPRSRTVRYREPARTFAALLWLSHLVEGDQ